MKKTILRGIMTIVALLTMATTAMAQMSVPQLPIDSAVRYGKLDNGLTYYIRHNETPKGQADFFIAQKVGSILENEEQRGLAHFLEHMCFNGTDNFPGNGIIDWCETVGIKFGQNLNAYTSIDETVYNISAVPTARTGVQDTCLMILHDWADGLTLDPAEIDKERGVIHQEWRRSMVGQMRLLENLLPVIYPDNKYGVRLPIGTMEVVDNFPPQALRDYYETWYRPDQQGVIVVGDIDVDYIEGKIKEIFGPIKMPENPQAREYVKVEDTPGTIYAIGADKEMSRATLMVMFKQKENFVPDEMKNTPAYYAAHYMLSMVSSMLNARLEEMAKKAECPFVAASIELGEYMVSENKDALTLYVLPKGNSVDDALTAAYGELLRATRTGFTVGEYERAKAEYLSNIERRYNQRANRENTSYAREYAASFTKGEPIPGIEIEYQMAQQFTGLVPIDPINKMLTEMIADDNRVVMALLPENDTFKVPTEAELASLIKAAEAAEYEPYKDSMKAEPLIPNLPTPVTAASSVIDKKYDATTLTYPNGLKVIVKPTKFKDNEIVFEGVAKGGFSAFPDEDAASIIFLPYAMSNHGLGTYTNLDLQKYLQGKQASVDLTVNSYQTNLNGTTTPKDVKTLMELLYMYFTDIEISDEEFKATQTRFAGLLKNQEADPQYIFGKELNSSLYAAPSHQVISVDAINKADRETTINLLHQVMAHPGRFTLVFVGDIDMKTFVPLVDQYLGSLPADRSMPLQYKPDPAFEFTLGTATTEKTTKMETPQTWVAITAGAGLEYTPKNKVLASMTGQILSNRLLKKIREEMGAVYSIGAYMSMQRLGNENVLLQIPFPMTPDKKDEVLKEIDVILKAMSTEIRADELDPIKEFMVKEATESLEKNDDWAGFLGAQTLNGVDTFTNTVETVNSVTTADVQNFMKAVLEAGNLRTFLLDPAK